MDSSVLLHWLSQPPGKPSEQFCQAALRQQTQLTKPQGALGRLEDIAVQLAAMQRTLRPCVDHVQITVFAADHGIVAENISAFPQSVTSEMMRNFAVGGGAINVMARVLGAHLEIINLGTAHPLAAETTTKVKQNPLGPGTKNFLHTTAMDENQLAAALASGRENVECVRENNYQLFIGGEMGIGNTTSAAALACALLNAPPALLAGPGSGLSKDSIAHKVHIIERALALHAARAITPLEALRYVGGFEIAALTGAYVRCAQLGVPVLIDGFICSVAALAAEYICPESKNWFIYAHRSAEPGHLYVLEALGANPVLDLGMRLGEGSGAAVAVNVLRAACALHNEMATFSAARVSTKLHMS